MAKVETYTKRNGRLVVFFVLFPVFFAILVAALGYKQILRHDKYVKLSERQILRRVILPGARGDIFDRNGNLLVGNSARFSASVYFNEVRKPFREEYKRLKSEIIARAKQRGEKASINSAELSFKARENILRGYIDEVNSILGSSYELNTKDFNRHFSSRQLLPLPLIKDLSHREHAILAERLPVDGPVQIFSDTARTYPYGKFAAHALGYVSQSFEKVQEGAPGEELTTFSFVGKTGKSGIEKAFDETLSGQSGVRIYVVDPNGFQYDKLLDIAPKKGGNIYCSLDADLQAVGEKAIEGRKGAVVALDIDTGEILALVSEPSYNPEDLSPFISNKVAKDITEREAWLNRATQGLYPPGSTFKVATACAGLMTGVIDPSATVNCTGGYKVGNRIFPCHKRSGHGEVALRKALAYSCNVYFYKYGLEMGSEAISAMAKEFGLDSSSGVELYEDAWRRSIVPTPEIKKKRGDGSWTGGDTANMSIGQGYFRTTPLQVACMTASFAAKRTRTKASILHDAKRKGGLEYHGAEELALSDEQYNAVVEGMIGSVEYGTSKRAAIDGVRVAAKSGTAQVMVDGRPLTLAWMIAFAPVERPEIAVAVIIQGEVPGDASGGRTAGPVIHDVLQKYFDKKKINDD